MEDNQQGQDHPNSPSSHGSCTTDQRSSEPVRSRWTPKPEQILILESIFNSGMVNPPKDETVRIRKLLEKFGTVGDANVFYWFQNRRSRSRRRQRQMQATLAGQVGAAGGGAAAGAIQFEQNNSSATSSFGFQNLSSTATSSATPFSVTSPITSNYFVGNSSSSSSSGCGVLDGADSLFSISNQMATFQDMDQTSSVTSILCPSETCNLQFQAGFITVFINGVPTEVPRGPLDMKAMFGDQDVILLHSSGVPVPTNEFGLLMQTLQHGESYFLVSRPT